MASPNYNTVYQLNERTLLLWGRELVTAGTVTAAWTKEEFGTFSWSPTRNIFVNNFRTGFPSNRLGTQETWHYSDVTINVPADPDGLAGYAKIALMGDVTNTGTQESVSAGPPYTHTVTPGAAGTRCVPFSFAFVSLMDAGATPALQFTYGTIRSIHLTGASPLMAEIQATCYWPTPVALPTGTWAASHSYLFGYQSYHVIKNSAGTTYAAQILDTDVTISRQLYVVPSYNNSGSQNPVDIIPYSLNLSANLSLYYDGMTVPAGGPPASSTKHYSEYLSYLKAGTSSNVNQLVWKDAATPTKAFEVDFWPAAWSTDTPQTADGLMTCTATLDAEQDFASATQNSPAHTLVKSVKVTNAVSGSMAA